MIKANEIDSKISYFRRPEILFYLKTLHQTLLVDQKADPYRVKTVELTLLLMKSSFITLSVNLSESCTKFSKFLNAF